MTYSSVRVSEIAEVKLGRQRSPKNHTGDLMRPYVRAANVTWSGFDLDDVKSMNFTDKEMQTYRLRPGDLLLSEASGSAAEVGKPAIWEGQIDDCGFQNTLIRVRPSDQADARYLLHCFRYFASTGRFARESRGVGIFHLGRRALADSEIPLPPIEEQRRIASILDAADALRAKRREAIAKLDTLTQAIFVDMFGDGGRVPVSPGPVDASSLQSWEWVPIDAVARMGTGHTPDRKTDEYWAGDISWINLNEIREWDGRWCTGTAARISPEGVRHSSAVMHPAGTVCFSRTASIGFVTVMAEPMTTSQDFVTWTCGDDLNPDYLMAALIISRKRLRASSSGSTHKTIYVRDAERFHVLLPPRPEQDKFAELLGQVRLSEDVEARQLAELDTLFASLQQRAFRGEF